MCFLPTAITIQIENARASNAPERRRRLRTWHLYVESETGAFTVTTLQDLNGEDGLSSINSIPGMTATIAGNVATLTVPGAGATSATRVTGASPLVGTWFLGDPALPNRSVVLVFLPNGIYFTAHDGDSSPATGDPTGHDGIEHGKYSWNEVTGLVTSSRLPAPFADTNGNWGLSHPSSGFFARVTGDTLTVTEGPDVFVLSRVGVASTFAPPAVVEYYHAGFDHYFITAIADEIGKLDTGTFAGWTRTGRQFNVYAAERRQPPRCADSSAPRSAPKSSHFYTPMRPNAGR